MLNLPQNGHCTSEETAREKATIEEPKKKDISVVCDLKQARWEQVDDLTLCKRKIRFCSLEWNILTEKYCL